MNSAAWTNTFPAHWRRVRLKNLVASITAGVWGEEPAEGEGVVCVRAADFDREHLRVSMTKVQLRKVAPEQFSACALAPGDLVLEKSGGGDRQPVGAVVFFDRDIHAVPTNFAARIRPHPTVNPRFLNYVFGATYALRLNVRSIKQTTGLQNLDVGSFLAEEWAIPSLTHQVRIADFLDYETARIDGLIERRRTVLSVLWSRWESTVYRAVTKGLGAQTPLLESGLGWAGAIPVHWTAPPVYANFEVQLGKMLNPERAAGPSPAPYLRNVNVQWDRVDLDDLATMSFDDVDRAKYALHPGDLLVCEGGEVGRAAIWRGDLEECYFQKAVHRVRARGDGNARFLMYLLWAAASMNVFNVEGNQATIAHLTAEKFRAHRFPMPPRPEQDAIVEHLERGQKLLHALVERINRQIDRLHEHRNALIAAAVTGQTEVSDTAA